jgi:hypothetical protein
VTPAHRLGDPHPRQALRPRGKQQRGFDLVGFSPGCGQQGQSGQQIVLTAAAAMAAPQGEPDV